MSAQDTYKSLAQPSEGLFKEKGSKFFAHAFPVNTEEDIKKALTRLKEKYHDARHHCYAYRLGNKGEKFRANDDGEPSNSAGKPILGQLIKYELCNCFIAVVRYFGGTKLGVGGLISAYKTAAEEAILNGKIIEHLVTAQLAIRFSYKQMNEVMHIVKREKLEVIHRDFQTLCEIHIRVRLSEQENISAILENTFGLEWELLS
ncbi:MAG: YigZ family protein [Bacteroidota bacterium]